MDLLLLEDDQSLGRSVKLALELEGFTVVWAPDLKGARDHLKARSFGVHLLDWNLPDGTGLDLAREILNIGVGAKILFLTARGDEESAVEALRLGAVDYVRKPFGVRELVARIKRAADRKMENEDKLDFEGLSLDLNTRQLSFEGKSIDLAPRESLVLEMLLEHAGEAVTRERILERIGADLETSERSIDSHLSHLRAKIKKLGVAKFEIKSSYGVGYVLKRV